MYRVTLHSLVLVTLLWRTQSQSIFIKKNDISLSVTVTAQALELILEKGGSTKLDGEVGVRLTNLSSFQPCHGIQNCIEFSQDESRLHVLSTVDSGFSVYWATTNTKKVLEDCFELKNLNWFGGPQRFKQEWPIEKINLTDFANVVQNDRSGTVLEPYWLNSAGAYIVVHEKVPLFINQNTWSTKGKVCFSAQATYPYRPRNTTELYYTIVAEDDAREGHRHAVKNFLGKPQGHPNYRIIEKPIWSTWARYKRDINDSAILNFAHEIVDNGYTGGQFEIDDDWEECYGSLTFRKSKFGNITSSVATIKKLNFTVTLWTHPFVNTDCKSWENIGQRYGLFVKNDEGSDLGYWWNSQPGGAHYLDFTKTEVREWFVERLQQLQRDHDIDSFKFDAGETNWQPQPPVLQGDVETHPNNLAEDYVRTCARFGDLVEVRVAWKTQDLPIFLRMNDKDSNWSSSNGLRTLITTLIQSNSIGYTLILPDMVGGNGYSGPPDAELFVRWLQANVFMPSLQFSYVPWDYKTETRFDVLGICKKMVELHENFAPYIFKQLQNSVSSGAPVNPPIWWVDPLNKDALKEDTEFLLGEDLLAAPVIEPNTTARSVVLPKGSWVDGNTNELHLGPKVLRNYVAGIEVLPYFVREHSEAHHVNKNIFSKRDKEL